MKKLLLVLAVFVLSSTVALGAPLPKDKIPAGGHREGKGTATVKTYNANGSLYSIRHAEPGLITTTFYKRGRPVVTNAVDVVKKANLSTHFKATNSVSCNFTPSVPNLLWSPGSTAIQRIRNSTPFYYYWNASSIAATGGVVYGGSSANNLAAIRAAHVQWNSMINCGLAQDNTTVTFQYANTTLLNAGVNDGVSVLSFGTQATVNAICGTAPPGYIVVACTPSWHFFAGPSTDYFYSSESDTLFNSASGTFAVNGQLNSTDLQGIMAHEAGHTLGAGHANGNGQVMSPVSTLGDLSMRKLGMGDWDWLQLNQCTCFGNYTTIPPNGYNP